MSRVFGILISFGLLASSGKIINFDAFSPGRAPSGWTVAMTNAGGPPRWQIVKDPSAPTPPYVLAQLSNEPNRTRLPLAILDNLSLRDADISVRLKPVSGTEEQAGGLVWRYRDENNYYLARANALTNTVTVYKVQNGQRVPLMASAKHEVPARAWSILKVSARGPRFQIYVDHRRILEGRDDSFTGSGKVGLATVGDSVVYFDDFRVNPK